jgi:hypothetical protein
MTSGVEGAAMTLYWKTVASEELVAEKQPLHAPELAKSSSPPPECQAETMYLTVVPAACGGIEPVATSTIWHDWVWSE